MTVSGSPTSPHHSVLLNHISSGTKSSKSTTPSTITSTGETERVAGGVCGGETDVERTEGETGGEADVVVAGEEGIDKSGKSEKTHTDTLTIM